MQSIWQAPERFSYDFSSLTLVPRSALENLKTQNLKSYWRSWRRRRRNAMYVVGRRNHGSSSCRMAACTMYVIKSPWLRQKGRKINRISLWLCCFLFVIHHENWSVFFLQFCWCEMVLLVLRWKRHAESQFHDIHSEKYEVEDEKPEKNWAFMVAQCIVVMKLTDPVAVVGNP